MPQAVEVGVSGPILPELGKGVDRLASRDVVLVDEIREIGEWAHRRAPGPGDAEFREVFGRDVRGEDRGSRLDLLVRGHGAKCPARLLETPGVLLERLEDRLVV